jgi:amino acid transporter
MERANKETNHRSWINSKQNFAPYGSLAIVVWAMMGAGAICLGLTFAKLARLLPETGGPYAFTRIAYGDFSGFMIAWAYWISIWASLPVIAVAFAGTVIAMFPGLDSRVMATVLSLAAIWAAVSVITNKPFPEGGTSYETPYHAHSDDGHTALSLGAFKQHAS